jgi:hypothetical protein
MNTVFVIDDDEAARDSLVRSLTSPLGFFRRRSTVNNPGYRYMYLSITYNT